jgi:hypothetical protein
VIAGARRALRRPITRPRRSATLAAAYLSLIGVAAVVLASSPRPTVHPTGARPAPSGDPRPAAVEVRDAAAPARRFLEDYLRYLHGRLAPSEMTGATGRLRARLARETVKASHVARRRQARIVELHTRLHGPSEAVATARVLDGRDGALAITVTLHRTIAGWTVSDVA